MNADGTFPERESWKLPMYLPSRFRSWCDFYAYLLKMKADHQWAELPKKVHISELGELTDDTDATIYQEFNIKKVKALAFDELWAVLPTKRDASITMQDAMRLYCGGPGADITRAWVENLFHLLPNLKQ